MTNWAVIAAFVTFSGTGAGALASWLRPDYPGWVYALHLIWVIAAGWTFGSMAIAVNNYLNKEAKADEDPTP